MGGEGSGRKPEYHDLYHVIQREKMREIYQRRQIELEHPSLVLPKEIEKK